MDTFYTNENIFSLPISAGATYVRKYFNEESRKAATVLAHSIHDEFIATLQNVTWMDVETRTAAIEKANAIKFRIAYPDELVDSNKLEEYYHGLKLQSDSLLHSVLRIRKLNKGNEINRLRKIANKDDWKDCSTRITKVDAYYLALENSIRMYLIFNSDSFSILSHVL